MVRDELSVMSAFLAVADEKSFTKAAKRLGVTQSALSHAIRGLEEQVGYGCSRARPAASPRQKRASNCSPNCGQH